MRVSVHHPYIDNNVLANDWTECWPIISSVPAALILLLSPLLF